jgi:hypothetical protein
MEKSKLTKTEKGETGEEQVSRTLFIFFGIKWIVHKDFVLTGQTVNSAYCCIVAQWQTNFLTLWSWALLKRPIVVRPLDRFPAFYGTRKFDTEFTRALHLFLSCARPIQSTSLHLTNPRSILILSTHLHLGLPSGFHWAFPSITYIHSSSPPFVLHAPPISSST